MSRFQHSGQTGGAAWTCKHCGHVYNPLEAHYDQRDHCPKCGSTEIEKTRSSLLVEWLRFLREKKPRFAIYENVKNITGSRFYATFNLFVKELEDYGYNVYWQVLNAKHYGIPQNRERVYCVIMGFINDYNGDANRVYDGETIARALKAEAGGRSQDRMV